MRGKKIIYFLKLLLYGIIVILIFGAGVFVYFIKDLPRPEKFTEGDISESTKIYDRTGEIVLYEIYGEEKRTVVPTEEIPIFLKNAVISTEDKNFFEHKGIDLKAILRAISYDLRLKRPAQGASTITQQLIRSYFLTSQKTLERKTREIILTLELERRYEKEQIFEWYLNIVPFGPIYGVEEASQTFFGKTVSNITLAEAATLAALIKSPSYLSPYGEQILELLERKNYVLERMEGLGYLTGEEKEAAQKEEIKFQKKITTIEAPHFVLFVKDYLEKKYGDEFIKRKGLNVYTTLDYEIQKAAEEALELGAENKKPYGASNAALLSINPKTGEILAMIGSKYYFGTSSPPGCVPGKDCKFDPQVNIVFSLRQPGSALKPFIYAKAFLEGLTPKTIVWDAKTEFNLNCPASAEEIYGEYNTKCYHPKNYDGRFIGPLNLRSALAQSRNVPSVKVLYLAGLNSALDFLKEFGITSLKDKERYGLSLVLGGGEVTLFELTSAYGVFANDGVRIPPSFIKKIEDSQGNILESLKINPTRIIPSQFAREINDILSDNSARAPMFGYNSALFLPDYESAAKTGTTQDYKDGWIVGYTPNLVTGVWIGNNDNSPMQEKAAAILSGPIWNNFMKMVLPKFPKEKFISPKERKTGQPVLDGILPGNHSILYYLNPSDPEYPYWEKGVENWLNAN